MYGCAICLHKFFIRNTCVIPRILWDVFVVIHLSAHLKLGNFRGEHIQYNDWTKMDLLIIFHTKELKLIKMSKYQSLSHHF